MQTDKNTKDIQKVYCRTLLAEWGLLTKALADKIDKGDEEIIRDVLEQQQKRIIKAASKIQNIEDKEIILTQVDSVQEILDNLRMILNA